MNRRAVILGGGAALLTGGAWVAVDAARATTAYDEAVATFRGRLAADPPLRELVRYATLAANGHNTQPWRFRLTDRSIAILPDLSRRTPVVDPDDHHLYVSLGCAAENLALAAAATGRVADIRFDPAGDGAVLVDLSPAPAAPSDLYDAIPARRSTRTDYDGRPVPPVDLDKLAAAAAAPGVAAVMVTERPALDRLRDLVVAANDLQMADPAFTVELKHWLRFNPRAALAAGDGLYSAASGNPSLPGWLGPLVFDLVFTAKAESAKYARQIDSSAGIVVLAGERADPASWIEVGRACQRFQLQAAALGLTHAFVNQPVEVTAMRPDLAALVGIGDRRPDIVMRFGYGPELPFSPRRPVAAVVI